MLRTSAPLYQHRGSRIVTGPATEPVTADQLRTHLVDVSDTVLTDAEAERLIASARQYIEDATGLAMIEQVWLVALDRWPTGREPWWDGVRQGAISELSGPKREYELPRFPLVSVDDVKVYDEAGSATSVVVANVFDIDTYSMPGRMALKRGAVWPVALRSVNAIEITYKCGYGTAADDVPGPLVEAVLQMAAYMWEHKGGCSAADAYRNSGASDNAALYAVRGV
jgi:hypothetical protein